ncbi:hypothetical protein [Dietzia lutea]|uniref:Htaa domain-containing protein n=1 Tax=Dietzia lutea TaxID=546160 RepID=A0A2S1R9G0_9ACTN|nr:hypothetical protein [Dietzia lutea]AWH92892.1 hypothetical protein A6035_12750 [Dietzia lutea]
MRSQPSTRAVPALTAALVAAALLPATAAIASADPTPTADSPATCATSQTRTFSWPGSLGTDYHLTKEVVGDGTAAPGGTVTFRTTVSGAGALVTRIEDFHPQGFITVSARESVWKVFGGQTWTTVTDDVRTNAETSSVYRESSGWTTAGGAHATLETTYRVPDDATPGEVFDTGAGMTVALANGTKVANPIGTCVTIREKNATEQVAGSLEGLGLGSLTTGSTTLEGIAGSPATFSADLINQIDVGQLLAGVAGS